MNNLLLRMLQNSLFYDSSNMLDEYIEEGNKEGFEI